jgi:zinc and cadmium transporter
MMNTLCWILLATIVDGLFALVGAATFLMNRKLFKKVMIALVAFSAGALLGGAFFHLMPEALEGMGSHLSAFAYLMTGFIIFFILEKFLYWHHCHKYEGKCPVHPVSYLILLGDGLHNIIDGLIIAASFFVSVPFGIITTLMIIAHEVPQELGDFAILVHGGMSRAKALALNFASQLTAVVGGVAGYFLGSANGFTLYLLPIAAGGFVYIGASDLIPELHKEKDARKSIISFLYFLVGIAFMLGIKVLFE